MSGGAQYAGVTLMTANAPSERGHLPGKVVAIGGGWVAFSGVVVLAYQAVLWLQNGFWTPFDLRTVLNWLGGHDPQFRSWYGVQRSYPAP
jgi:hypothetical protein